VGTAQRVVAVVAAFRPAHDLVDNVAALRAQVDQVVIVDDGSGSESDEVFSRLPDGIVIVRSSENRGIAEVLNVGCEHARTAGADLVLTMDQDSALPNGFVESLLREHDRAVAAGRPVGIVAPASFDLFDDIQVRGRDGDFLLARNPIQSGSLFTMAALDDAGPFDSGLFIDLIDVEYVLRLEHRGWQVLAVEGLRLPHRLGTWTGIQFFGRPVRRHGRQLKTTISTPFRYYYRVRNRVIVARRYRGFRSAELRADVVSDLRHYAVMLASVHPAHRMVRIMLAGLLDGVRGRTGRMPAPVEETARRIRVNAPVDL
jgi:rhamnosyltransferase